MEAQMSSLISVHLDWVLMQNFHWGVILAQLVPLEYKGSWKDLSVSNCPCISKLPGLGLNLVPFCFLPKTTNRFHPHPYHTPPLLQPESEPQASGLMRRGGLYTHSFAQHVLIGISFYSSPRWHQGENNELCRYCRAKTSPTRLSFASAVIFH